MANDDHAGDDSTPLASKTLHPKVEQPNLDAGPFRLQVVGEENPHPRIPGFRISHRLGEGGMGVVYRAFQESMQREVALKIIAPQQANDRGFCERFVREARAAGSVTHPNVVGCFDVAQADGHLYMVLELISGGDACRLAMRNGGRLDEATAIRIAIDCCRGLVALHRAGVVHRDVKPANIYITMDGSAKLGDLGLARYNNAEHLTRTGTPVGTPAFMAPEQVRGEQGLDGRADIYALGASLFAMVTGGAPYVATSPWGVLVSVLNDPIPDVRDHQDKLSSGLAGVITKAMAKDPTARYQTAEDMLADLETVARGAEPLIRAPSVRLAASRPPARSTMPTERMAPQASKGRPRWRRRAMIAGAAALMIGLTFSLWTPTGVAASPRANGQPSQKQPSDTAPHWQSALSAAGFPCTVTAQANGELDIVATDQGIADLTPLIGVPATRLDLSGCRQLRGDLSALTGMRLRSLTLAGCTGIASLNGIQGMPLERLDCSGCASLQGPPVQLRGMPLQNLSFAGCSRLASLDGLQGMPLEALDCSGCAALRGDLLALRGTRLRQLDLEDCARLVSLDGIADLPLERVVIAGCRRLENAAALRPLGSCVVQREPKAARQGPANATMASFDW